MIYAARRFGFLAYLTVRRIARRFLALITALLTLHGCATFDKQYTVKPTISRVQVQVFWGTLEETKARCGQDAVACATIGTPEKPMSDIYAVMPASFTDRRVCVLGEEFLHSLGARHGE